MGGTRRASKVSLERTVQLVATILNNAAETQTFLSQSKVRTTLHNQGHEVTKRNVLTSINRWESNPNNKSRRAAAKSSMQAAAQTRGADWGISLERTVQLVATILNKEPGMQILYMYETLHNQGHEVKHEHVGDAVKRWLAVPGNKRRRDDALSEAMSVALCNRSRASPEQDLALLALVPWSFSSGCATAPGTPIAERRLSRTNRCVCTQIIINDNMGGGGGGGAPFLP
eukprot:SAG31_NODE_14849_length_784_cov_1.960584_1_plen_228_part_10